MRRAVSFSLSNTVYFLIPNGICFNLRFSNVYTILHFIFLQRLLLADIIHSNSLGKSNLKTEHEIKKGSECTIQFKLIEI